MITFKTFLQENTHSMVSAHNIILSNREIGFLNELAHLTASFLRIKPFYSILVDSREEHSGDTGMGYIETCVISPHYLVGIDEMNQEIISELIHTVVHESAHIAFKQYYSIKSVCETKDINGNKHFEYGLAKIENDKMDKEAEYLAKIFAPRVFDSLKTRGFIFSDLHYQEKDY